jgi:glycopeptide antibiotics resistance protein
MAERIIYALFALLLVSLAVAGVLRAVRTERGRPRWMIPAVGAWLAATVFMTVRPGSGIGVRLNLIPVVVDGPGSALDAILNFFVFVPPGILLATLGWRLLPVLGAALAVTLGIELTQYVTDWGRTADVNDLITNVLGAGLGWLSAWSILRARSMPGAPPTDDAARDGALRDRIGV